MTDPCASPGSIWHVPCSFTLNGCRVRAEALARRLWPSGSPTNSATAPFDGLDVRAAVKANSVNGRFCYECPDDDEDDEEDDLRPIVPNARATYGANGWEKRPGAGAMLGGSEDDEFYDPPSGSSPPSPAIDDIVVNPPVALPTLYRRALDAEEDDDADGRAVSDQPRRQPSFRRSDAVDIRGLYEKLQRYADSKSLSDPDSDTFYDADSSPDEASTCDSVDGDPICRQRYLKCNGVGSVEDALRNGHCDLEPTACRTELECGESASQVHVPNSQINRLADLLYGECKVSPESSAIVEPESESTVTPEPSTEAEPEVIVSNDVDEPTECPKVNESSECPQEEDSECHVLVNGKLAEEQPDVAASPQEKEAEPEAQVPKNRVSSDSDSDSEAKSPVRRTFLRSTSLKSGKTPPGTPHRKKIVRFADALGLDLELVRTIASDDLPHVPASAYTDLQLPDSERPEDDSQTIPRRGSGNSLMRPAAWQCSLTAPLYQPARRVLCPEFGQPVADLHFLERVRSQTICLENVLVTDTSVNGVVRVLNISYEKSVLVRYTVNEWTTTDEVPARYVQGSCDGFSDKFAFTIHVPFLSPGQRLVFALRFVTNGQEYWDNNFGVNYVLRCNNEASQYLSSPSDGPIWLHHFI